MCVCVCVWRDLFFFVPVLAGTMSCQGFERLDLSRNHQALRDSALADHLFGLLRFNKTVKEVAVDGLEAAGPSVCLVCSSAEACVRACQLLLRQSQPYVEQRLACVA